MEFALQTSGSYSEVLDAAQWAEANGLAAFAIPDHYLRGIGPDSEHLPAEDGLIQLAGLARETETIPLVVLVSPITFRHPAVYLKTAVTIDRMSGGRLTFGLGTGWLEREHEIFGIEFPATTERFEMLEEALAYFCAGRDGGGFAGDHYRLEDVTLAPAPAGPLPLVIGGVGKKKTPALAGRFAGEYNVYPSDLDGMRQRIALAHQAAVDAGRDPADILLSSAGQVLTAPTQREYEELLARTAAEARMSTDELEAAFAMRGTPRGTHEQVAEMMAGYAELGIERFYLQRGADFDRTAEKALIDRIRP